MPKTKSQIAAEDVVILVRARNPLIWIVTREETRVESHLFDVVAEASYKPRTWDVDQGLVMEINGKPLDTDSQDPMDALAKIRAAAVPEPGKPKERNVWILRDLPTWLEGIGGARTMRRLRNLVRLLPGTIRDTAQTLIVLSPSGKVPDELSGHATVIEWPMPDRAEIAQLLDDAIAPYPKARLTPELREAAIDAAVGLNGEEAQACYAKSLVQLGKVDPVTVGKEKRRVVAREGVIEWYDPLPDGLAAVGGLDALKGWLTRRKLAYSASARSYGLPAPKGMMLVGVSGCGKSWTAKATATAFGVPLLRVDLGSLKSKFVGDSERNLRKVFDLIKAIGRCVVWFDEIEKSLQGATSGSADGGVSSDALGAILSWMQERQGEAFCIATANDISGLPPELLRKGRFDEIWFVDLPNEQERIEVLKIALHGFKRDKVKIDYKAIAEATNAFTGSEIAAIVPDALFTAFEDGEREITTRDIIAAAEEVVPLSETAREKIRDLRAWATERARAATSPLKQEVAAVKRHRVIDVEA